MVQLHVSTHTYNHELQKAVANVTFHFPDYSDTYMQCGCFLLVVYFAIINFRTVPLDKKNHKNEFTYLNYEYFWFSRQRHTFFSCKGQPKQLKIVPIVIWSKKIGCYPFCQHCHQQTVCIGVVLFSYWK